MWKIHFRPTSIDCSRLLVRSGDGTLFVLELKQVSGLKLVAMAPKARGRGVLDATFLSHPNVMLTLAPPLVRRRLGKDRNYDTIILRVDKPDELAKAIRQFEASLKAFE